jgi:uncharacterized repeat protein (TIGR03803 family)
LRNKIIHLLKKIRVLICALFFSGVMVSQGQYTVLFNFNSTNTEGYGYYPGGSLTPSGNTLYGMIQIGGSLSGWGGVFKIDTNGSGYTEMLGFNGANGAAPVGSLLLSGGTLYGMTDGSRYGSSWGNIFSLDTSGNNFSSLLNFDKTDGEEPQGSLIISGSTLFGMVTGGGTYGDGLIVSIDTNGSNFKELLNFDNTNGVNPNGDLVLLGGKLYGMTESGGKYHYGLIFSIDTNGNGYKDLLDFNDTNGAYPDGTLTLSGSKLYGMTSGGGLDSDGLVFSIDTNGTGYKDLLDFNGANGAGPEGSLTILGARLYGMTWEGGAFQYGCIFSVDTNGGGYKKLLDFNDTNGAYPEGNDLVFYKNAFYGMTSQGGLYDFGVIFKIDTNAVTSVDNVTPTACSIKAYPNPSKGLFILSLLNSNEKCNIEIYNVVGEKIYTETLQIQDNTIIDLIGQPNGIYFYRVLKETGALVGSGKLIIEK